MGKAKKSKKDSKEDEIDDEVESKMIIDDSNKGKDKKGKPRSKDEPTEENDDLSAKKKKGKKDRKKNDDDDDDDINEVVKDIDQLTIDKKKDKKQSKKIKQIVESSEEEEEKEEKQKQQPKLSKGKQSKKNVFSLQSDDDDDDDTSDNEKNVKVQKQVKNVKKSFALLEVEDGDSGSGSEKEKSVNSEEESAEPKKSKGVKKTVTRTESVEENERTKEDKSGGKKSKKKKKKQDDDEDEIEKVLAELGMEYSGVKTEDQPIPENKIDNETEDVTTNKSDLKKKSKKKAKSDAEIGDEDVKEVQIIDGEEVESTMKTAAQKKKEKKEREKQKKMANTQKKQEVDKKPEQLETVLNEPEKPISEVKSEQEETQLPDAEEGDDDDKKKKKKKKGKGEEEVKGKGPNKKTIAAMQEALKKLKEEEERLAREEEVRQKKIEEAQKTREEQKRLEQERKDKKKQKEKERKERLKAEGKFLTAKQKADRARALAMIDALKAQGVDVPAVGEKKSSAPRPGTRVRLGRGKSQQQEQPAEEKPEVQAVEVVIEDRVAKEEVKEDEEEDVKDAWDADSSQDEEEDKSENYKAEAKKKGLDQLKGRTEDVEEEEEDDDDEDDDEADSGDESEEESSEEESEDSEEERKTDAERKREKALARIQKRREDAEKNKSLDVLRAAVVCVLGHVDTGKTKILDKLRRTNVQDGEAGGITQQIGATNVPIDAIKEQTKFVKGFAEVELRIPGLLIIDTPGHESFSNLRSRGSSLCDIAILVVDIMHGLEPQTLESINLLKSKKTPFIVALNKIDRLYDWQTMGRKDVRDIIKGQASNTQLEFEQRTKEVIVQFAEQGFNAALFYENPDIRSYVSLVPTSAITGEGMGNLLALIVQSCQNMLAKRLMYSEELQATVLEVKAISGLGTTIDAILINGKLREGDTMVLAGTDGPIVTQIRSLLMPQPMKELRVKNAYVEYKEIKAAQGVKIAAKELEKAIAGLNLQVAQKQDEVEILRDEVSKEFRSALSNIKLQERGVYVQASTLGSLEALLEFLRTSKIPYANIRIGPVVKKDVMKASTMLEHDSQYATILAFDVKVERDAQELADTLNVKIFQADIIYHLFDKFMAYREELRQKKREEFKNIAVFPCQLKVLPQFIFNSRDPIVMGVIVEAGIIKEGTPICVPSREFVDLGIVTSIEVNHKSVESARKGMEVCIKIEPTSGDSPKMYGRHFDETDLLVSKISRQSIDACKDYFREDLLKTDWQLMVELKKQFQIL